MHSFRTVMLLGAVGILLLDVESGAQIQQLPVQREVVIKLRVHRNGRPDETGAGIYVGKDQKNAYFITAYHVIAPDNFNAPVHSVDVEFRSTPKDFVATILADFDPGLDLGVVSIALESLPPDMPQLPKGDAKADTLIHIIGHPSASDWSVWTGNIQNENAPGDTHHFATSFDKSLAGGYSGGPVFDSYGHLIGIHTESFQGYGVAIKLTEIVNQLLVWRVPTNNIALGGIVPIDSSVVGPEPDWSTLYKEKYSSDELELSKIGESAFNYGKYDWSRQFLERAKELQRSGVWQSRYPFYAADLFILGRPDDGKAALQEMLNQMNKQHVYLSHDPPRNMVISNLEKARAKVPAEDRLVIDRTSEAVKRLIQDGATNSGQASEVQRGSLNTSSNSRDTQNLPAKPAITASTEGHGFAFVVQGCERFGDTLSCSGSVSNKMNRRSLDLNAQTEGNSTVVDNKGTQYRLAPPGQNTIVFGASGRRQDLENDLPITYTITLRNFSTAATSVNLLLACWTNEPYGFFNVTLRNVPVVAK